MWLPEGWWIITEKSTDGTRFTAGAKGLPEIESSAKFRSDRDATGVARKALRSMAYENQDSGWSKFRCHARLPGQLKAFCGARIENTSAYLQREPVQAAAEEEPADEIPYETIGPKPDYAAYVGRLIEFNGEGQRLQGKVTEWDTSMEPPVLVTEVGGELWDVNPATAEVSLVEPAPTPAATTSRRRTAGTAGAAKPAAEPAKAEPKPGGNTAAMMERVRKMHGQ